MKLQFQPLGVAMLALALQSTIGAQEPATAPKPATPKPIPVATTPAVNSPLRLQFVISKYQGEKKISSLPYSLSVNTNSGRASLRMGADVPYPRTETVDGKSVPSYAYRTVGVSIDGLVAILEGGLHRVDITVIDDSIDSQVKNPPSMSAAPVFRNFRTTGSVLLKDGQTTQLTTAADPTSGEVMRVDVTLTVVK